jgi:hypothetical protein
MLKIVAIGLAIALGVIGVLVVSESFGGKGTAVVEAQQPNCSTSYQGGMDRDRGGCIRADVGDYDCAGGTGNGPNFAVGPVTVVGTDVFELDSDNDRIGCEEGGGGGAQPTATPARTSTPAAGGTTPRATSTPAAGATPQITVPGTGDGGLK